MSETIKIQNRSQNKSPITAECTNKSQLPVQIDNVSKTLVRRLMNDKIFFKLGQGEENVEPREQ